MRPKRDRCWTENSGSGPSGVWMLTAMPLKHGIVVAETETGTEGERETSGAACLVGDEPCRVDDFAAERAILCVVSDGPVQPSA